VNAIISVQLGKKVDNYMFEQEVNESPSSSSSLPSSQGDDVCLFPMIPITSKDMEEPKESESIHDSTSPKDSPNASSGVTRPPPPFPNKLKGEKV